MPILITRNLERLPHRLSHLISTEGIPFRVPNTLSVSKSSQASHTDYPTTYVTGPVADPNQSLEHRFTRAPASCKSAEAAGCVLDVVSWMPTSYIPFRPPELDGFNVERDENDADGEPPKKRRKTRR